MQLLLATWAIWFAGLYLAVGVAFALYFVWRGVNSIDPSAQKGSIGFRLLITPGTVALWPLMVRRLRAGGPLETIDSAHDIQANGSAS